tara:strand:+ start:4830 stop:5423 length:594 start_codon:yes stop_codon:yes gene_type:complete
MSNLTIEDLAALINQAPKAKKPRKKTEQTPEQRELMLEKLALMREKSLEKRNAKKAEVKPEPVIAEPKAKPQPKAQPQVQAQPQPPPQPAQVQPNNDLFEKHYNSKFERLEESISGINNSINQMKQLKLEKAELKKKKAEEKIQLVEEKKSVEPKEEGLSQVKTQSQGDVNISTPPQNLNPNRVMKPNVNYKSFFKR